LNSDKKMRHGTGAFVLSGLSFIPLIGVIPGLICVVNALVSRKGNSKKLGLIGFAGIMFSVVLYGAVLPFAMKNSGFTAALEPHAKSAMTSMVRNIEYYKLQNNTYPANMDEIRASYKEGELAFTFDMSGQNGIGKKPRDFYYELINNDQNYLLFGVGIDSIPFTEDDIYPIVDPEKDKNIGWVMKK